jgi:hypothetical protein
MDYAIARLSSLVAGAAGIKSKATGEPMTVEDFMPWTEERELTLEEAMQKWT